MSEILTGFIKNLRKWQFQESIFRRFRLVSFKISENVSQLAKTQTFVAWIEEALQVGSQRAKRALGGAGKSAGLRPTSARRIASEALRHTAWFTPMKIPQKLHDS